MDARVFLSGCYHPNQFSVAVDKNEWPIGSVTIQWDLDSDAPPFKVTGNVPPVIVAEIVMAYYRDNIAFGITSWDGDEYTWDEAPDPWNN